MGSQTNHNASYLYEVDGITVWERLRVIRNFLSMHRQSLALSELNLEKIEYDMSKLTDSIEDSFKRREYEITLPDYIDVIKKCRDEIAFLEKFESELMKVAETTRIPGKTDDEMYEENFFNELIARNVRKAHCELISTGQVSPDTMQYLIKCPPAIKILNDQGLLKHDNIFGLVDQGKLNSISYAEDVVNKTLLLKYEKE